MLDYLALFFLIFASIVIFYAIIAIHDIPYEIAKKRNHPHLEAIHYAGWVSLFTLHVIWPFLWIWATLWDEKKGWGNGNHQKDNAAILPLAEMAQQIPYLTQENQRLNGELAELRQQITQLAHTLDKLAKAQNNEENV